MERKLEVYGNGDYAFVTVKGWKGVADREVFFTKEEVLEAHPELKEEVEAYWDELVAEVLRLQAVFCEEARQSREDYIAFLKDDGCYYDGMDDD